MDTVLLLGRNLLLTVLIEGALVFLCFRKAGLIYRSLLCNLLTNPALNLAMLYVLRSAPGFYWIALLLLESAAVLVEALVYRKTTDWSVRRALLVSLLLNGCSCAAGFIL